MAREERQAGTARAPVPKAREDLAHTSRQVSAGAGFLLLLARRRCALPLLPVAHSAQRLSIPTRAHALALLAVLLVALPSVPSGAEGRLAARARSAWQCHGCNSASQAVVCGSSVPLSSSEAAMAGTNDSSSLRRQFFNHPSAHSTRAEKKLFNDTVLTDLYILLTQYNF